MSLLKTIFLIVMVNGEVHQWCDYTADDAYINNVDYYYEEIDYIENTYKPCEEG